MEPLGPAARTAAIAIAHHRFNYIHPFPDGNGRVSRLVAHAMAHRAGIGAHGLWSISRGLARGIGDRGEYGRMMDATDAPRESDLDGRGNLSLRALEEFVTWFCELALDQLTFMSTLFDLKTLSERLEIYVTRDLGLSGPAVKLCQALLQRGDMPRGEASAVTGLPERTARQVLSRLIDADLVRSDTPKGPYRCASTRPAPRCCFQGCSTRRGSVRFGDGNPERHAFVTIRLEALTSLFSRLRGTTCSSQSRPTRACICRKSAAAASIWTEKSESSSGSR